MEITQSILNSIKKMIGGISADDEAFDADLIIHINSAFSILSQLGVGPAEGFEIKDSTAVWTEFVDDDATFNLVKSYIYLKVKLVFDPPLSSAVLECPGDWLYSRLGKLAQQVTDQLSGSTVSDVTEKEESTQKAFKVKVSTKQLRIRKGPGTNYGLTGAYTGVGTFTIVEKRAGSGSAAGWGRLQSGAGWIALDYVTEL